MKNIITELLEILQFIKDEKSQISTIDDHDELLKDIMGKLTSLMSSCLSSPVQGRLTLAMPPSYLPASEQQTSLLDQKNQFFGQS